MHTSPLTEHAAGRPDPLYARLRRVRIPADLCGGCPFQLTWQPVGEEPRARYATVAALGCAAGAAPARAPSLLRFTDTSLDTPGSCIVTP